MDPVEKSQEKADVEKIVAEIRSNITAADMRQTAIDGPAPPADGNLYENLEQVNTKCQVGQSSAGGSRSLITRVFSKLNAPLISDINSFNASVVRTLNKIVKLLEGKDTDVGGDLLSKTTRRINLMARLSDRLEQYDDIDITESLKRLEDRISELERRSET